MSECVCEHNHAEWGEKIPQYVGPLDWSFYSLFKAPNLSGLGSEILTLHSVLFKSFSYVKERLQSWPIAYQLHGTSNTKVCSLLFYRDWEEGKVLIFDDSFEHEVWQDAESYRLIFIVDVWHPELTAQQRRTLPAI